jgi:predicted TIM-barrel fold metal-dependent hydrolase
MASMTDSVPHKATIDCHAHIFTTSMPLAKSSWTTPATDASLDRFQSTIRTFGIERAVIAASSLHEDNVYSTEASRAHAGLKTTVIVPPTTPMDRLTALNAAGACGVRLQLRNREIPDLCSPQYRRFLRDIVELGWHVELHDDSRRLPTMINAIEESGAPLVIDHFGRPGPEGTSDRGFRCVLDAVRRGRTWVKISAAFRLEDPLEDQALASELLSARGTDRLLWGSDWPFVGFETQMNYAKALTDFERAVPDSSVRSKIDQSGLQFYFGADAHPS